MSDDDDDDDDGDDVREGTAVDVSLAAEEAFSRLDEHGEEMPSW